MEQKTIRGIVESINPSGKHGPYATASSEIGLITFSLETNVWKEKIWPETGTYVVLTELIKKRAGWRAQHGRFFGPSDEGERL